MLTDCTFLLVCTVLQNLMNAKMKHMDPSVQCSADLMTLKVKGVRAPHLLVDSGRSCKDFLYFLFS